MLTGELTDYVDAGPRDSFVWNLALHTAAARFNDDRFDRQPDGSIGHFLYPREAKAVRDSILKGLVE